MTMPFYLLLCVILLVFPPVAKLVLYFTSRDMPGLKTIYKTLGRDIRAGIIYIRCLAVVLQCYILNLTAVDSFQKVAKKHKNKVCFICEDKEWTYLQVDEFSNKIAHSFLSQGYRKGDEVALFLENCPEYVCIWLGLAKIGVVTAFINTHLRQDSLAYSVNSIDSKAIIFGRNLSDAVRDAKPLFQNREAMEYYCYSECSLTCSTESRAFPFQSLNNLLADAPGSPGDLKKVKRNFKDKLLYIYTSGTTGPPKPAIIRHSRYFFISAASRYACQLSDQDIFYNALPMYHTAGGILFVSVLLNWSGTMVLKKKFSASNFWREAVKYNVTVSQYIGEMCRYLLSQPKRPEENRHSIRVMYGNGLRSHIWKEFQDRFKIKKIIEFYGSTEGNAHIINIPGKTGAVGFVSRIFSRMYPAYLIKLNPETGEALRNDKGLCICCKPGEPGEMVGNIFKYNPVASFDGYANRTDTKKKIITDCFRKGDMAFLSGDILVMDDEGYLYFIDRTGDTFRWRGENVSTTEVENIISQILGHVSCVVYGVQIPNVEGRAGMAAIQISKEDIDVSDLYQRIAAKLPTYAIPLFIRICSDIEATGTYKLRKVTLKREGYNLDQISDLLLFADHKRKTYVRFTKDMFSDILSGKMNL